MNGSIKLGSVLGITIRVHVLLLLLAGFLVLGSADGASSAIQLAILFGVILLHELAHSVVAMRFGLRVVDITLWPLGGMARMSEMPESSKVEGLVAIAGPLMNFVLAGLALPVLLWVWTLDPDPTFVRQLLGNFLLVNLLLGGFNLLPAFPMDGGRILRALLGRNGDWLRATQNAVTVGRMVALLLGLFGLVTFTVLGTQSVLFILIAVFVWWAGGQELLAVRMRHGLDPLAAFRAFATRATGWSQSQPTSEYAHPGSGDPPPIQREPREGGFSEEEIEKLERFRGPLSSFGTKDV